MMIVSVARSAVFQPRFHAYCAIAEPSSCATFPKLNAKRPLEPYRFGPIWSVPMHGATASTPRLIAVSTTGAASSTSHVTKSTAAFWLSRRRAQAFATSALLLWVSQVRICSFRPSTPPFALIWFTRNFAAANAGPSNGAMLPVPSNAQPMMIGAFALRPLFAASALPIRASASSAAAATANLPRPLIYSLLLGSPATGLDGTGRYLVNLGSVSRLPRTLEGLHRLPRQLCG